MTATRAVRQKIARLEAGGRPRVLDLFSGCGGLSLGFHAAGFEICAAVELDPDAARSHGLNFHGGAPEHSQARDITITHPEDLAADLKLGPVDMAIDVIVGGPPCQAFARVGRSKLREIEEHPEAFKHDPRARLYQEYLRYVNAFQPLVVLIENVPDVLNHGGQNIAAEICEVLEEKGYVCGYTLLNAAYYGVPQTRERMFLIAYRREVADEVRFPEPTHWVGLPPGYDGTRAVALKLLKEGNRLGEAHAYLPPPEASQTLPRTVTAEEAIGDMPPIYAREEMEAGTLRRGARRFDEPLPYDRRRKVSAYAKLMRTWPGFAAPDALRDHVIRYLPRDYPLFARLNPGDQYPQAWQHALDMLDERLAELKRRGTVIRPGSAAYERLKGSIVPPYDAGKFPNKWRKMWRDQPARTLMAHFGKDSYSHIHYDSAQARTISVREAARLQSFPDGFVFCGTMNPAGRQIGNAVPPLLARAMADQIMKALQGQKERLQMNLAERQRQFAEAVQNRFNATKSTRISRQFGVSNSAKIIEGGIQIGVPNLDTAGSDADAFILACVIKFPPEDEVYFAVLVRSDRATLYVMRLDAMKQAGAAVKAPPKASGSSPGEESEDAEEGDEGTIKYSARNNLAATYIASDGRLYLRNARFWDSLKFDLSTVGPGVVPDEIVVALYPPTVSARRSLLAREFIGYLGSLVGREKVHELTLWPDESTLNAAMRRLPAAIPLAEIEKGVSDLGGFYPGGEVRRYHGALNFLIHKHLVILSGLSGSGKTRLALQYARAVHGLSSNEANDPLLFVCPVRPEWTDPTGLTGYYDVLSNRYVVPRFLEAVLVATAHRDAPVFVVLDEMNLARVEYYFADVLSCIETGSEIQLHSNGVPIEGSTGTSIPAALPLPPNLYITGTINVDETTNPVSDKVLDRAIVIDMSEIDLPGFLGDLQTRDPTLKTAREAAELVLVVVHKLMQEHRLGFGYRVAEEVVRYHAFAAFALGAASADVMDQLMVQKVLVKLRGADRQRPLLIGLQKALLGMPKSQDLLARLTADLDEFGSFQATR